MSHSIFQSRLPLSAVVVPVAVVAVVAVASTSVKATVITEASVQQYAALMKQAANNKDISKISKLVAGDALISISRRGKTTNLDKKAYLQLLQSSWLEATSYNYDIKVSNIVTSGTKAKADVITVEKWVKNGKETELISSSRTTLKLDENNAILLRAVVQMSVE